jgi:hypothetical protein
MIYTKSFEAEVLERLARIEEHTAAGTDRLDDHENRLRTSERRQWLLAGAAVALGPILSKLGIHLPTLG